MEGSGSASTSIDIEELLKEVPDSLPTTLREEICIYHVPVDIRQVNKDAYTPQVICIGPIHQKNENQVIKELKRRYFKQFFNRLPVEKQKSVLEDLVKTITGCVDKIRNCYEDAAFEPRKDQKVFWKMILWDAVFIFELFLKKREFKEDCKKDKDKYQEKYKYDCIIGKPWLRSAVERDLILLENQLPFWILDDLYGIVSKYIITCCSCLPKTDCSCRPETYKTCCSCLPKTDCSCPPETDKTCCSCLPKTDCCCPCITFPVLACTFFEKYNKEKTSTGKPLHFTDLVRSFFLPKDPIPTPSSPIENLHRATRLHQAGVKFKPEPDKYRLYSIRSWTEDDSIKKGEFHVPTLLIDDHTECIFRNLIALEQCHYPKEAVICEYVKFLDFLVDTKEDADLLIRKKVIVNRLGESDDVAKLINKLCLGMAEVSSRYKNTAEGLNKYYGEWRHKRMAYLRRHYFKNIWMGTGTVVGLIVLLITLGNFVRSFF